MMSNKLLSLLSHIFIVFLEYVQTYEVTDLQSSLNTTLWSRFWLCSYEITFKSATMWTISIELQSVSRPRSTL